MNRVCLVYHSYYDNSSLGLAGGGDWTTPEIVAAFTNKTKARNWVRKEKLKHKGEWWMRFSYKTLKVT